VLQIVDIKDNIKGVDNNLN